MYILIGFELYLVLNAPKDLDLVSFLLQTIVFFIFAIELAVPSPPPLLRCPLRPPPPPSAFPSVRIGEVGNGHSAYRCCDLILPGVTAGDCNRSLRSAERLLQKLCILARR